jgi:hypothetical protein
MVQERTAKNLFDSCMVFRDHRASPKLRLFYCCLLTQLLLAVASTCHNVLKLVSLLRYYRDKQVYTHKWRSEQRVTDKRITGSNLAEGRALHHLPHNFAPHLVLFAELGLLRR